MQQRGSGWRFVGNVLPLLLVGAVWWLVYRSIEPLARWLTYGLLRMGTGRLASAVEFFLYEAPKVLLLLVLVVFGASRLPGLGKGLGEGMRSFRDALRGNDKDDDSHELEKKSQKDGTDG